MNQAAVEHVYTNPFSLHVITLSCAPGFVPIGVLGQSNDGSMRGSAQKAFFVVRSIFFLVVSDD